MSLTYQDATELLRLSSNVKYSSKELRRAYHYQKVLCYFSQQAS